ncbi:hypothetical protein EG328_005554 [Venturia inaequalis]|uniref:Uncharacterized protein n=1 Tax=Venturia inaequalis TaxID=5025 RepID=A0A8H3UMM1_VENIN|nr:hypothetical protein EG328_005554 [Venturia inaequalis]
MPVQPLSKRAYKDLNEVDNWSPTNHFPGFKPNKSHIPTDHSEYIDRISLQAQNSRPDLRFLQDEFQRQRTAKTSSPSRLAVLEITKDETKHRELGGLHKLEEYWEREPQTSLSRLYMLEDITASYVGAFGSRFNLDPSFFARHLRNTSYESSRDAADTSPLPSASRSTQSYCIWYPETVVFSGEDLEVEEWETSYFCHCNLYRQISFVRGPGRGDSKVGTIMRKMSVFVKDLGADVWEGLIVVDPPVGPAIYAQKGIHDTMKKVDCASARPYKGGFIDFLADHNDTTDCDSLKHISLLDNIIHYALHPRRSPQFDDTIFGILSLTNRIAREKISRLESLQESTKTASASGWPTKSYEKFSKIGASLQEIGHWRCKSTLYHTYMESNVADLTKFHGLIRGKSLYLETTDGEDWKYLLNALEGWKRRTSDDVQATFALLSLLEGQKSVDEAQNSGLLAMLGVIYLPFSLAAGILSMGGDFAAGADHFWIFFALAIPMLAMSLVLAFTPRLQTGLAKLWRKWDKRNAEKTRDSAKGLKMDLAQRV